MAPSFATLDALLVWLRERGATGLCADSRQIRPGDAFVAWPGAVADARRFVRAALEEEGCEVHEADRVERGLIEAGTRQPDAVILDLGLPDGDGMQLIRELRTWTEVPVLVLSARVDERDKIEALDAG
ncbi:response regulator, partial [Thermomonas alba]|uniref:response regulator n=1 Tax=Thermomonas alba TaxID=2888525 RepID=UPI001F034A83